MLRGEDSSEAKSAGPDSLQKPVPDEAGETPAKEPLYVVGVGASAGGLEALETFFDAMPPDSGMAFVVIQHLSPDFRSLMDELLSRHTAIAIRRVEDGMRVEPNAIYLIPPKKEMIVSGGRLLLTDKDPGQGLALPIDIFFRSLAQDVGPRAVGVILSGTGSDGSRGIRHIREAGGLVVAQSPESAKFDGMPRSAIETGAVDFVRTPQEIPRVLLDYVQHPDRRDEQGRPVAQDVTEEGMDVLFRILRDEYGIDFSYYKPNTVGRRVERRLELNRSLSLDDYIERLRRDPAELNSLYRDLLIGVTKFFRDEAAFARLESDILPQLLAAMPPKAEFRAWVAGCATGEEAYSLAMLVHEHLAQANKQIEVKIFATDVHRTSLDFAAAGIYSEAALSEVSPARLERYFIQRGDSFQISPELRKMIVFAPHNVIKDAPFTKLHLISCRNLLIYLQPQAQKKALSLFHFGLHAGGILLLGPSESPGELSGEFEVVDTHWKIYRKHRDSRLPLDVRLPMTPGYGQHSQPGTHHATRFGLLDPSLLKAYDALLAEYVPPSILLNHRRELVHTFAGAGRYLVPRDGRPSPDVLDMFQGNLKLAVTGALQRAAKEGKAVAYSGVMAATTDGEEEVKLTVKPVTGREGDAEYMLISLERVLEAPAGHVVANQLDLGEASRDRIHNIEDELRRTKENLQATVEEMETSNEELQATNEELVASNEELQSTNEELHSVNEELYTVNAEYQRKIVELTELNNDMDNLFANIDVGAIFLDRSLRIRKFNPRIAEAFNILPQDVGRPIGGFAHNLQFDDLPGTVQKVLATRKRFEQDVQDRQGDWYLLRVVPYELKSQVSGAVVLLIDIAALKNTEDQLKLMSKVFVDSADPIVIEDLEGRIVGLNPAAERAYGWKREDLIGRKITTLIPPKLHQRATAARQRCLKAEPIRNVETFRVTRDGQLQPALLTLSLITGREDHEPVAIASIAKDISDLKRAEEEAREAVRRRDEFLAMLSHELRNPLGAVLNATRVMQREANCEEARDVIRRQSEQMAHLLDDLLDVSRVTRGKIEIQCEALDLRSTVAEAVETMRPMVEARGQELSVVVGPEPVTVCGDRTRLQQIQVNLLNNASKYTPEGGRIELSVCKEGEEAVLKVCDSGEGIAPDMLEHIFDMFVQSQSALARSEGGMGVGLTLVRSLVEMHGGSVAAHSEGQGRGSEFIVRIPCTEEPVAMKRKPNPRNAPRTPRKVLVVEDNADSRVMLESLLRLDGHEVQVAENGLTGVEAVQREDFDVALVDIGLPELDGYEVARRIRRDMAHRKVYLVALTGYGREADQKAARQAGFDEHLVKPLNPADLDRVLARPRD